MVEDKTEEVLKLIRMKGPLLPIQITKEIKCNTMFAGAILSQLVDSKKAFLTNTKIGGSPVYYIGGQEPRLIELYKYLNEKDRRTFDLLKQHKVLRDREQNPLTRVSLRNIKDFAKPLEVKISDSTEIFWKWFLTSDDEATKIIKEQLKIVKKEEPVKIEEPKTIKEEPKVVKEERKIVREELKKITEFTKEDKEEVKKKLKEIEDNFLEKTQKFLKNKNIEIINFKILKKNSEIEFVLKVPSAVGVSEYYCKAKNKKRISDSDLSSAYVQGQLRKMPVIFLTTGELAKKAQELLNKEFKINVVKL